MRRLLLVHGVALALALTATATATACDGGQRLSGINDSTFVRVMAELRTIQEQPWSDSTRRAAAIDSVLQSRGLTPEALETAARAMADDPERAVAIWRSIDRHVRGDTVQVDTLAPEPQPDEKGAPE
jgi:hypothetical protein